MDVTQRQELFARHADLLERFGPDSPEERSFATEHLDDQFVKLADVSRTFHAIMLKPPIGLFVTVLAFGVVIGAAAMALVFLLFWR